MNKQLRAKLEKFDQRSLDFDRKIARLYWDMFHGKDVEAQIQEVEGAKSAFVAGSGYAEMVKAGKDSADICDRREFVVRHNALLVDSAKSQAGPLLQKAGTAQYQFRLKVDDKELGEGEAGRILSSDEDRMMREKVWRAQEQSLALGDVKKELVDALNAASIAQGSRTFVELVLRAQDASGYLLFFARDFESKTRDAAKWFMDEVTAFSGLPKLEPWDVTFYTSRYLGLIKGDLMPKDPDSAMALLKHTLSALGFDKVHGKVFVDPQRIDKPPFTFDIKGGEGYLPEECAMSIAPGVRDYRVFINPDLSPTGLDFMRTLLLESGRVLHYDAMNRRNTRDIFKWDSDCMRHAIAMLFDSMSEDAKWLHEIAGLSDSEAKKLEPMLRLKKMMMARKLASDALFEDKLYCGDEPSAAFRKVQEMFFGKIDHEVEKRWALHPYLAFNPAGQMSYVLGYMISKKIEADIRSKFGQLIDPRVAEYLVDNYLTGYEKPWPERVNLRA